MIAPKASQSYSCSSAVHRMPWRQQYHMVASRNAAPVHSHAKVDPLRNDSRKAQSRYCSGPIRFPMQLMIEFFTLMSYSLSHPRSVTQCEQSWLIQAILSVATPDWPLSEGSATKEVLALCLLIKRFSGDDLKNVRAISPSLTQPTQHLQIPSQWHAVQQGATATARTRYVESHAGDSTGEARSDDGVSTLLRRAKS